MALRLAVAQIIAGSDLWSVQADPQKASKESIQESLAGNKADARFAEERKIIAEVLPLPLAADQTIVPRREDCGAGHQLHVIFKDLIDLDDETAFRMLTFVTAESLPAGSAMVEVLG